MNRICVTLIGLLLVQVIPATSADSLPASPRCMAYGEAKAVHRGAYLHWRRGTHGRRCWGVKERNHNGAGRAVFARSAPADEKQQPKNEPPFFVEPWNLLDHPGWAWIRPARLWWDEKQQPENEPLRFVDRAGDVIFTTFPLGQEPEIWPVLETEAAALRWAAAGALLALVLWALALVTPRALLAAGVRPP